MSGTSVRVVVADDHTPTRLGVVDALAAAGMVVVADVATAPAAVAAVRAHRPDVALLDVHMPGNGTIAAADIRACAPDTTIVMLTVSRAEDDVFDAIRAGASGYVLKDTAADRLAEIVRNVVAGESVLPRSMLARVATELRAHEGRRPVRDVSGSERLSAREWEVLDLLVDGCTTNEIAARLYVAKVTVRSHVAAILRKLEVTSRDEVLRMLRDS